MFAKPTLSDPISYLQTAMASVAGRAELQSTVLDHS